MSSSDILKYKRMEEQIGMRKSISASTQDIVLGLPPIDGTVRMYLAESEHETIREIVREELRQDWNEHIPFGEEMDAEEERKWREEAEKNDRQFLEDIRQTVREEIQDAIHDYSALNDRAYYPPYPRKQEVQALDSLLEAVQGEPDPDDEIAAILAEMSESEWEALVQKVKGMKRE